MPPRFTELMSDEAQAEYAAGPAGGSESLNPQPSAPNPT